MAAGTLPLGPVGAWPPLLPPTAREATARLEALWTTAHRGSVLGGPLAVAILVGTAFGIALGMAVMLAISRGGGVEGAPAAPLAAAPPPATAPPGRAPAAGASPVEVPPGVPAMAAHAGAAPGVAMGPGVPTVMQEPVRLAGATGAASGGAALQTASAASATPSVTAPMPRWSSASAPPPPAAMPSPPQPHATTPIPPSDPPPGMVRVLAIVTGYCPCTICCGPNAMGITAIGRDTSLHPWGVAADPHLLPYRTHVRVPGYGRALVDDTGGAMREDAARGVLHLDVRFPTHAEALAWGVRWLMVDVPGDVPAAALEPPAVPAD